MMFVATLLSLLIGQIAAQHNHEGCTYLGRDCISEARCNKTSKTCVCPDGYVGNGLFDCWDKFSQRGCTVTADPHLMTWDNVMASITFPCWYRVTTVSVPVHFIGPGRVLEIEVLARNLLTPDGLYYVEDVKINVSIIETFKGVWDVLASTTFDISASQFWNAKGASPWKYPPVVLLEGLTFRFLWDPKDNFVIFTPDRSGIRVKFRAFTKDLQRPLRQMPGLSVVVLGAEWVQIAATPPKNGICMVPGQGELFGRVDKGWRLGSPDHSVLFFILSQTGTDQLDGTFCNEVKSILQNCSHVSMLALKHCDFLLRHRKVLTCLQDAGQTPMEIFADCLHWVCNGRQNRCRFVRRVMDNHNCHLPVAFRKMGCDRRRLARAVRRFAPPSG